MSNEIDLYLNNLPKEQKSQLSKIRSIVNELIPEITERLSTNVPAFYYKDKYLVSMSATKNYVNLLVMRGDIIDVFREELLDFETGSRIIRFTPEKPLKNSLIKKIILKRKKQIDESN